MSTQTRGPSQEEIVYPDSDGQPMADNTLQYEWITTIKGGLDAVFQGDPNVFVAGDLLWYSVEGDNTIRTAPDAMVVIGRPKGYRGSYLQWREAGIPPQVVFEVLSPGNRRAEMARKFRFYERYGVEEYYIYDPDRIQLTGWIRRGAELDKIPVMDGWISPRLAIRFELAVDTMRIYGPDQRPFASYVEVVQQRDEVTQQRDAERLRADRLAAQLRALGVDPER